ncbi:MAG: aminoglycoside phosphotransferase family protein [Williamsia sp.]|nr:aminoglycoside phosphotransferase family protein [Williamsia sp.]
MTKDVLPAFGIKEDSINIELFGSGLINHTWKVTSFNKEYILQKVNHRVFAEPHKIARNQRLIANYLRKHHPDYMFIAPITSAAGHELIYRSGEGYFRLFPFVADSHSKDVVETPRQAYEAARQFGRFTRLLSGMDVMQLETTIPDFHNLALRYQQFLDAVENGNRNRRDACQPLIEELLSHRVIVEQYEAIKATPDFKLRVTHHDTKISNVLFDKNNNGMCVIDLDTVMPGYFISDVGDMMRTYLSPVSEEETDFSKIQVREEMYNAVVEGYYSEMKDVLTSAEKGCFFYAGKFMIYMQAIRFITDHLNNDVYYGVHYKGHNLVRAENQAFLLARLIEKQARLEKR